MPIILIKQISENISISVWHITETEECFFNSLQLLPADKTVICNIKLSKVRLQKLACRAALAELLDTNEIAITYSESGQPQLKGYHISFSHTEKTVAVALSKTPIGIDIEKLKPRILPLYSRFMNPKEIENCDVNNLQDLYFFWCAKEAMYKWYALKNLDFIEDLFVMKSEKKGVIYGRDFVELVDIWAENFVVVVCF
jgi:4'-phosphopantetheinyl transferase EntD